MKLLLICGAGYVSGKEIIVLDLLKGLKSQGHECFCITSSWRDGDFEDRLNALEIPYYNLRLGFISKTISWSAIKMTFEQLLYLPGLLFGYKRIIKRIAPHIVIHTNFHHVFLLYPVLIAAKNIYWSHELIAESSFFKRLFNLFVNRIHLFIGVSEAVSESLRKHLDDKRVQTIRNGTPLPVNFNTDSKTSEFFRFAIVGQVAAHKGHEVLFKALKNFRCFSKKVQLHIIGTGSTHYIHYLKELADQLNIAEIITWRGFIKDPNEIYEDIDCVIAPTVRPEPLGLIVLEAAVRGIPSIASDSGGITELIIDGYNGFLFKTGDEKSLAATIMKMIEFPDFKMLRHQSRDFAFENFLERAFIKKFDSLLKEICDDNGNYRWN